MSLNHLNMKRGDHAIVIGGSISGLLAARVLADYFTSVTMIETDKLPEKPVARKGVPQSVQPHVLLARGYRILEELFPGIGYDLSDAGALPLDWAQEFYRFDRIRGWNAIADSPSDIVSFTCSRPLLEWCIRQRVLDLANVRFIEKHQVTGLLCNSNKTKITGVCLRSIPGTSSNEFNELQSTLVVDASGRRSQAPKWLENLGLVPPPETVVNPFLGYATRRYKELEGFEADWKVMLISHTPPNDLKLGYLAKIEDGEWIATLGGYGHDFPPTDNEGFLEFARSLSSPKFYEAIKEAEPISPIFAHRATANRLRHYEKVEVPNGFVCLGDAVCALCPVYGQGLTVSALSVMVLKNCLSNRHIFSPEGVFMSSRFQEKLAKSNSVHWNLATMQDSSFATTKRFPPIEKKKKAGLLLKIIRRYNEELLLKATTDARVNTLIIEVLNQLKPPAVIFHPRVILRVLGII